jgi:hypothetical protein
MPIIRNNYVSIGEIWFDEEIEKLPNVDVIYYIHRSQPIPGIKYQEFYTILIDLTKEQNELWQDISKNDQYKIRRAGERDNLIYEFWYGQQINDEILENFVNFYDKFANIKGLSDAKMSRLKSHAASGILDISHIKSENGEPLVWHVHYHDYNRAFLLHSASMVSEQDSNYNSLLGRANRYHHWQDMLRFKDSGAKIYDFGGWYAGKTDQKKLGINKFKEKFGGEIVKNFNYKCGQTWKGMVYLGLQKLLANVSN